MVYFFSASSGNGITYRGNETAICSCVMVAVFPSFATENKISKNKFDGKNNETIFLSFKYSIQVLFNRSNNIPHLHAGYHS
ncbi:MAG: hypothetical protein Q8N03_07860 [Ignavibacteria bacterium]|nr:hypothetical protein [Ignavibacteria bacterium]MDP3831156.1 hypothetical protein [Ignavibacteriaceae bacterium]